MDFVHPLYVDTFPLGTFPSTKMRSAPPEELPETGLRAVQLPEALCVCVWLYMRVHILHV